MSTGYLLLESGSRLLDEGGTYSIVLESFAASSGSPGTMQYRVGRIRKRYEVGKITKGPA